ncbi:hypothetical protein OF83DRAFT_111079 [Amylostereum chailletii]|nr:hypothetical protein OF83DRAFT_111079 [Amylostereum chailletii]
MVPVRLPPLLVVRTPVAHYLPPSSLRVACSPAHSKYENVMDEVRALREQIESFSRRAGPDRYADPGARPHGGAQPSLLSMSKPREPSSDENESSDDDNGLLKPPTTTPVEGSMDHFSPLPAHLSPAPAPMNAFSPLYEHLASEYPDSKDPPPPSPQPSAQSSRRSKPASPDGSIEKADYVSASTTKPMAISGVNAVAARFYDLLGESSASGSSSLPHPHPATYYSKRQEKQREQASLSRNNSSSAGSGSPGSRGMSSKMRQRVNRLQLQLVPDSSDEGEVNARHQRMYKLTDILTTPLPAARALGAPGEDNEGGGASRRAQGEAPAPPPAPPPPPPHWQCTTVSHASAAAQALERERERRRKESGGSYASTRSTPPQEPPVTAPATFASSTASERPRAFMERRDSSASTRSGYEGKSRRLEA